MCNVERSTVRLYYHTWRWSRWVCTCMCKTPFCCCLVAIGNVVGLTLMPKVPNNLHCTEENIGVRYSSGHSHTFTQSFTHSLTYPLTHTLAHPLTHSFTHTHSLTHSLTPFPQSSAKSSFSSSVSYTTGSPANTCVVKSSIRIPYWCVIRRMRLYFHRKVYTWDAPNKEHFFQCRYIETCSKTCT